MIMFALVGRAPWPAGDALVPPLPWIHAMAKRPTRGSSADVGVRPTCGRDNVRHFGRRPVAARAPGPEVRSRCRTGHLPGGLQVEFRFWVQMSLKDQLILATISTAW